MSTSTSSSSSTSTSSFYSSSYVSVSGPVVVAGGEHCFAAPEISAEGGFAAITVLLLALVILRSHRKVAK